MTNIRKSVQAYEDWMGKQLGREMVAKDIALKHEKMRESPFVFLRATYWRWAETILDVCPDLADATPVLGVGDIHLENFGTWRDADGRLVWGVNDFDEAAQMPYALDLVRLAASALLASPAGGGAAAQICAAVLDGYTRGLRAPKPIVLDRDWAWLREALVVSEKQRAKFWSKIEASQAHAGTGALSAGSRRRHAATASRHVDRAPDRRHRQPGTATLDRRCRMARSPRRARAQGGVRIGLDAGARARVAGDPLRGDRQRAIPGEGPLVPPARPYRRATPFPEQPQDRSREGERLADHARLAAGHGPRARQRASGHRPTAATPSRATSRPASATGSSPMPSKPPPPSRATMRIGGRHRSFPAYLDLGDPGQHRRPAAHRRAAPRRRWQGPRGLALPGAGQLAQARG